MGKLVVVYGMESELERGLELLHGQGLGDEVRVIQRTPEGDEEADVEAGRDGAGAPEPNRLDDVVVPPSATLGTSVPLGTPAAFAPYGVTAVDSDLAHRSVVGYSREEIEDITGSRDDEAGHLLDVVSGGGALLVVEGDDATLDRAESALGGHTGQGTVRH